ncbi:MAG TPA: 30S ribosomal protein S13 [archaeon]|jgi:small subunit ribosomal protein S13|nr:30S ribosomal protein S13 [archaeon]HPV66424.1 30S ribosomal protein S13 [archaeon]
MAKDKKKSKKSPEAKLKKGRSEGSGRASTDRLRLVKPKPKPSHFNPAKEGADFKHIVRIANRDIPGYMTISDGLTLIYGISYRLGKAIEDIFFKDSGKVIAKVGNLTDKDVETIENIIANLDKRVPAWLLNRPKQRDGTQAQYIMADLKLVERKELQRLGKSKSYRGLRLQWGLRVRGQKSKSTGRKHSTIGVEKKK